MTRRKKGKTDSIKKQEQVGTAAARQNDASAFGRDVTKSRKPRLLRPVVAGIAVVVSAITILGGYSTIWRAIQARLDLMPLLDDPVRDVRLAAAQNLAALPGESLTEENRRRRDRGVDEYIASQLSNADRPEAHHNLGVIFMELRRAPENAHFAYVYAVAVASGGDRNQALAILRELLRRHAFDRESLFAAAGLEQEMGHVDEAIAYASRLES